MFDFSGPQRTPKFPLPSSSLFCSPGDQIAKMRTWNVEHAWGLTREHFARVASEKSADNRDPQSITVLVPNLGSDDLTARLLWTVAATEHQGSASAPAEMMVSLSHEVQTSFPRLRWLKLDLSEGCRLVGSLDEDDESDHYPGVALICALALFPNWVRSINSPQQPRLIAPGLRDVPSGVAPIIFCDLYSGTLAMNVIPASSLIGSFAVPRLAH